MVVYFLALEIVYKRDLGFTQRFYGLW